MKKSLVFAVMLAIANTCAASENEYVNQNENVTETAVNVVDEILNTIDGDIVSKSFYAIDDNLYTVEYGKRIIRVRDFRTNELLSTTSIYLCKENGEWVDGANTVLYDANVDRFVPAKALRTAKGIKYQSAKHAQWLPGNRVKQLEKDNRIRL